MNFSAHPPLWWTWLEKPIHRIRINLLGLNITCCSKPSAKAHEIFCKMLNLVLWDVMKLADSRVHALRMRHDEARGNTEFWRGKISRRGHIFVFCHGEADGDIGGRVATLFSHCSSGPPVHFTHQTLTISSFGYLLWRNKRHCYPFYYSKQKSQQEDLNSHPENKQCNAVLHVA